MCSGWISIEDLPDSLKIRVAAAAPFRFPLRLDGKLEDSDFLLSECIPSPPMESDSRPEYLALLSTLNESAPKEVALLKAIHGQSISTVAKEMGLSHKQVTSRAAAARKEIRKLFADTMTSLPF